MATEDFTDRRSTTPSGEPRGSSNPLLGSSNPLISDLEQEVLDEYSRLLDNVNKLSDTFADLAGSPASLTLDGLRLLERKTATVYTLLKASVYSIVLQQQIITEGEAAGQQQQQQHDQYAEGVSGMTNMTMGGEGDTMTQ
ncbi:uncharacterized protein TRUGW13939_05618 [Talaromyces rugulosus]|uniref:DASH complex subunit DAD3 n=1 Tax=Talaromyces rugulosus TaxID=121627 RepID=A0A7H8QWL2_TALRU|nr:uncharacterized protein TRUGW13939_05618 [Talaromyces rugulosus]QKX58494.1 hypothetical protein TRUGW13939_05618 [Talaromyces rugulosus]